MIVPLAIFGSTNLGMIFFFGSENEIKNKIKMGHFFTMKPCSGRKKIGMDDLTGVLGPYWRAH
jgi:hypothetical protein